MPPKNATAAAVGKTLADRREQAREAALKEVRALRGDLNALEAVLTGKRKKADFSPFDVVHGAFEIFRHAASVFEAEDMLAACARELEAAKAQDYLQRHGANELVKPAGWHWISPRGEMHFLGKSDDADKAAAKLAELLQAGRRPKRKDKADGQAEAEAAAPVPAQTEA